MQRPSLKNKEILILVIVLVIAALLRFWHYAGFSYSNDELSALYRTRFDTFSQLVRDGFYVDGHPGGVQVFLFYWVRLFGMSEASVRLPFVITGVLCVLFTWLIASRWFNRVTGLFCTTTIAFLHFPLLYSQIARPYTTGLLFVLIMVYFWSRLLFFDHENSHKRKFWMAFAYTMSLALCLYDHYFSFLFAVIVGMTGVLFVKKSNYKYYFIAAAIGFILFIPHIPITLNHMRIGGVGLWLGKPGVGWLAGHLFYIFNRSLILTGILVILILISLLKGSRKITLNKFQIICLVWFILPFLIGMIYSRLINPLLQDSVLLFSFPFLILFLFSFLEEPLDLLKGTLLLIWTAAGLFSTIVEKDYYHSQHFGEFKGIAENIAKWDKDFGEENITKAINVNNPWYIEFYLKQVNSSPRFVQYDNRGGIALLQLKHAVDSSATPFFLYAWTKPAPLEIDDIIRTKFPYVLHEINYGGLSAISLHGRNPSRDTVSRVKPITTVIYGFEQPGRWGEDTSKLIKNPVHSGQYGFAFDSAILYGPAFSATFSEITHTTVKLIKVSVWVYNTVPIKNAFLVISVDDQSGRNYIWSAESLEDYLDRGEWGQVFFNYELPKIKSPGDRLKIYIWNNQHLEFNIDDITIAFYD
jgi:hypothetical protein